MDVILLQNEFHYLTAIAGFVFDSQKLRRRTPAYTAAIKMFHY